MTQKFKTENDQLYVYIDCEEIINDFRVTSDVRLSDVVGLREAKNKLLEWLVLPLKFPQLFTGARRPMHGYDILLYGYPGCGKSHLVKAIANEISDCTLFHVCAHALNPYRLGFNRPDSHRFIRTLFDVAKRCPASIIAIDEPECLYDPGRAREEEYRRARTEFLAALRDLEVHRMAGGKTIVILCSNDPLRLAPNFRRRFLRRVPVDLPDHNARVGILEQNLDLMTQEYDLSTLDITEMGILSQGWTASDLISFTRDVSMTPLREISNNQYFCLRPRGEVPTDGGTIVGSGVSDTVYVPCSVDTEGSVHIQLSELTDKDIYIRRITLKDMKDTVIKWRSCVDDDLMTRIREFHKDFGPEEEQPLNNKDVKCLKRLARQRVLDAMRPALAFRGHPTPVNLLLELVESLPIPRSLKIDLMLGDS